MTLPVAYLFGLSLDLPSWLVGDELAMTRRTHNSVDGREGHEGKYIQEKERNGFEVKLGI